MTNLFNFMDGSDGMAAQEALYFFTIGGYFLFQHQAIELAALSWGLSALLAGFLVWNWPVARIFMGDSGSYFLGFSIAMFAIIGHKYFQISLVVWGILTSLFWFDATVTLIRRILNRDQWRKPHRLHAYQRLIQYGWSHQTVLILAICINALLSGLAYFAFQQPQLEMFSFYIALIVLTLLYLFVEFMKPMYRAWYGAAK
jgi:Fuc2NAc and GlcNAc transferase